MQSVFRSEWLMRLERICAARWVGWTVSSLACRVASSTARLRNTGRIPQSVLRAMCSVVSFFSPLHSASNSSSACWTLWIWCSDTSSNVLECACVCTMDFQMVSMICCWYVLVPYFLRACSYERTLAVANLISFTMCHNGYSWSCWRRGHIQGMWNLLPPEGFCGGHEENGLLPAIGWGLGRAFVLVFHWRLSLRFYLYRNLSLPYGLPPILEHKISWLQARRWSLHTGIGRLRMSRLLSTGGISAWRL